MEIVLVLVALAAVAVVAEVAALSRRRWQADRLLVHDRALVNLKSGNAVEGLVVRTGPGYLILVDARVYEEGTPSSVKLDGEAVVYREHVDFIQRIQGKA